MFMRAGLPKKRKFFSSIMLQNASWLLSLRRKKLIRRDFILNSIQRTQIPLKIGARNFWKNSPFKRLTLKLIYFYVAITRDFELF